MPTLVNVPVYDKQEGKEDEETFLSQVCEKLCSSDCNLLVSKLFNMLHNESYYTSDVVSTVNDKTLCPSETDNLDMSFSGFEKDFMSETNEK